VLPAEGSSSADPPQAAASTVMIGSSRTVLMALAVGWEGDGGARKEENPRGGRKTRPRERAYITGGDEASPGPRCVTLP
jgi:hypothetical protein